MTVNASWVSQRLNYKRDLLQARFFSPDFKKKISMKNDYNVNGNISGSLVCIKMCFKLHSKICLEDKANEKY